MNSRRSRGTRGSRAPFGSRPLSGRARDGRPPAGGSGRVEAPRAHGPVRFRAPAPQRRLQGLAPDRSGPPKARGQKTPPGPRARGGPTCRTRGAEREGDRGRPGQMKGGRLRGEAARCPKGPAWRLDSGARVTRRGEVEGAGGVPLRGRAAAGSARAGPAASPCLAVSQSVTPSGSRTAPTQTRAAQAGRTGPTAPSLVPAARWAWRRPACGPACCTRSGASWRY